MSETELLTGKDAVEQQVGGREPLPEWNPPAADEPKEYDRGDAGIVDAANDLSRSRSTQDDLVKIIDKRHDSDDRKYYDTVENAAHDLSEYHKGEQAIQAAENLNELAAEVDQFRAAVGQPGTQQQTAQGEQPPQPADAPQPEAIEQPSGLSQKVQAALADPEIRQVIEAPIVQAEQARQAYNGAVQQVAEVALSSVLANFPELAGYNAHQLPTVLAHIQKTDPHRAALIQSQLQQVNAVYSAAQQAKHAQAQQLQAEHNRWVAEQDAQFEKAVAHESPETMKAAAKEIVDFAKSNGLTEQQLGFLWQTNPVLRSSAFQQLLMDAARFRIAQRTATSNRAPHALPSVQRPGTAPSPGDRNVADLSELRNEFKRATGNRQLELGARLTRLQRESRR